jgi:hypothetical protein
LLFLSTSAASAFQLSPHNFSFIELYFSHF